MDNVVIRDRRNKGWFWMDNDYFNGYARHLGPIALSVYLSLCRHADNVTQTCFPSIELIAKEIGSSKRSVIRYLSILEEYNIISVTREKDETTQRQKNNIYLLLDKTAWKPFRVPQVHTEPGDTDDKSRVTQRHYKETQNTKETHRGVVSTPLYSEVEIEDTERPKKEPARYKEGRKVLREFPNPDPSWSINVTELKAAQMFSEKTIEERKKALDYCKRHINDDGFPIKRISPYMLMTNWRRIDDYAKRNR